MRNLPHQIFHSVPKGTLEVCRLPIVTPLSTLSERQKKEDISAHLNSDGDKMEQIYGNLLTYTTKHKETQALSTENRLRQV